MVLRFEFFFILSYFWQRRKAGNLNDVKTRAAILGWCAFFFFYMETIDKKNSVWHKRNYNIHLFSQLKVFHAEE